jgi:cell division protein FtsZ
VLFNVTGGPNMTLFEVNQAAAIIRETAHPDVNMIFGAVIDPNLGDEIRITVIATGFERSAMPRRALEKNTRENKRTTADVFSRPLESVSVHADVQPGEAKPAPLPPVNKDDLDIPTFLRNRR